MSDDQIDGVPTPVVVKRFAHHVRGLHSITGGSSSHRDLVSNRADSVAVLLLVGRT